jgi:hypothetical protein
MSNQFEEFKTFTHFKKYFQKCFRLYMWGLIDVTTKDLCNIMKVKVKAGKMTVKRGLSTRDIAKIGKEMGLDQWPCEIIRDGKYKYDWDWVANTRKALKSDADEFMLHVLNEAENLVFWQRQIYEKKGQPSTSNVTMKRKKKPIKNEIIVQLDSAFEGLDKLFDESECKSEGGTHYTPDTQLEVEAEPGNYDDKLVNHDIPMENREEEAGGEKDAVGHDNAPNGQAEQEVDPLIVELGLFYNVPEPADMFAVELGLAPHGGSVEEGIRVPLEERPGYFPRIYWDK